MFCLTTLGKVEKAKVSDFGNSRKLFCLPLIAQINEKALSDDHRKGIEEFWVQAASQIENLERLGKVSFVFVESVTEEGDSGLEMVKKLGNQCYRIVKRKIEKLQGKRPPDAGYSIVPVIPAFPLALVGIAKLVDLFASPWGTRVIFWLHFVLGVFVAAMIAYSLYQIHRMKRQERGHS